MNEKEYKERREILRDFYKSKLWRNVREIALKRDNYLCQYCGKGAEIVHHKIHLQPENINDYSISVNLDNLISVCHDCHDKIHAKDKGFGRIQEEKNPYTFDENGMLIPKASIDNKSLWES